MQRTDCAAAQNVRQGSPMARLLNGVVPSANEDQRSKR